MKTKVLSFAMAGVAAAALLAAGLTATSQTGARSAAALVRVPDKAEDFRLVDQYSKAHLLSYYKNSSSIVIVSHATGSSDMNNAALGIRTLAASAKDAGAQLFLMNSTPDVTREAISADMKALNLDLPVLIDDTQLIGESLGISRVAQALVIDPKGWKVVYSGPIGAKLNAAVDALKSGKPVQTTHLDMTTATLAFPLREKKAEFSKISYSKDVAPILAKNCVSCHAEGGIGPFPMNSYDMVKGMSGMIREAVRTDRMPPYNADPHVNTFKSDMNLTTQDQKTLIHWIEAGAPKDGTVDPLKVNAKVAPEWELGEPDLILTLPSFAVPATGIVDYQNPTIKNPLTEGRWLRASTINVGDRKAVHHLLSPVGGYAVGAESTVYPEGTGTWVEPGATFRFQMHYTPYGKATTDVTRVGLYFYPKDKPPTVLRRGAVVLNAGIEIGPNEPRHQETAYITFPEKATLFSVFPHAHYRGENVEVSILKAGATKEEMILALPKYDFNWQRGYEFKTPIQIEPGTKLITRYQYDNSKNNPANPDPNITVRWGEQSHQEMQYTALGFRWNDETVSNRKNDYQARLEASRSIGMMDVNIDGKVAKTEVRGRMGQMLTANFDKLDADKDGFLSGAELDSVNSMLGGRINQAQSQQSIGQ